MEKSKFSVRKRLNSFKYAFKGLRILILEEHNARIHLGATIVVVLLGLVLQIERWEWVAILFAVGLVFSAEIFNSALENMADFISQEKREEIRKIKDLSAAAVLVSAFIAAVVGFVIFLPKLLA